MASIISRNLRSRILYTCINFQCRSFHSFPSIPDSSLSSLSDAFSSNLTKCKLLRPISINHRFLSANSTNKTPNSDVDTTPLAGSVPEANAGTSNDVDQKSSSGGSHNTSQEDVKPSSESAGDGNSGNSNDGDQGSSGSQQEGKSVRGGPVSWMSFFLLFCTGAGLVYYYDREKKRHIEGINDASNAVRQGPSVGKAAIGGPFNLIDHDGKSVTEKDFLGRWNLLYFGFTHCPDICPDELQKMASAIDKIKEKSGMEVVPVFISVDPERDTVEQVHEYVKEFHPKLIGLTGDPVEVKKAARAYRVYYMKTEEEGSDYLVDHSIVMYLMDPDMQFVKFFGKNFDDVTLADGVIQEIKQHKKVKA